MHDLRGASMDVDLIIIIIMKVKGVGTLKIVWLLLSHWPFLSFLSFLIEKYKHLSKKGGSDDPLTTPLIYMYKSACTCVSRSTRPNYLGLLSIMINDTMLL